MKEQIRRYKFMWYSLTAVLIVVNLIFGLYLMSKKPIALNEIKENAPVKSFPFQELTIPYLRTLEYKSSLGQRNQATEAATYTGYLTSYTSDGLRINGYLTIPKGQMPQNGWPAIVFVHGYIPPRQYNTLTQYSSYVDQLARQGFVVFKIDLRGHADSEGEPGGAYYSSDYITDVLSAYSALENSDFVDGAKIGLWGHSMAGNVVFRSFAVKPQIPAVVIWAGAVYSYTDDPKDPGINGGIFEEPEKELNAYSCVIGVENIDKVIADIKAAGGKVYDDNKAPDGTVLGEKMDIPGIGIYAKCEDTEGNRFTLLQPHPGQWNA